MLDIIDLTLDDDVKMETDGEYDIIDLTGDDDLAKPLKSEPVPESTVFKMEPFSVKQELMEFVPVPTLIVGTQSSTSAPSSSEMSTHSPRSSIPTFETFESAESSDVPSFTDDDNDDRKGGNISSADLVTMFSNLHYHVIPRERRLPTPALLVTPLLEYQKLGLEWMIAREKNNGGGGILADQMGLGKTIQSIALIFQDGYRGRRTTLVVCPASLTRQWKEEILDKVPTARVLNYHETRKSGNSLSKYDVVIGTYHRVVLEFKQSKKLNRNEKLLNRRSPLFSVQWSRVILDEAHQIRNRRTQACKAVGKLSATHRWCLTGTPIQNRIADAFAYIQFLRIAPYNKWGNFRRNIENPFGISSRRELALERLHAIFKIFCLRREKSHVLDGKVIFKAAEKTEILHKCTFSEEERDFYLHIEKQTQLRFQQYLRRGKEIKRQMFILALLTQLRQAACHPSLIKLLENVETQKKVSLNSSADEDNVDDGDLPFRHLTKRRRINVIDSSDEAPEEAPEIPGKTMSTDYKCSTKIEKTLEIIRATPPNEKIIVFSSFTSFLDILDTFLAKENLGTHYYTGSVTVSERHDILKKFASDGRRVLLMSLKCGGLGLNLTCATQVILMDPWWNPAMEDQAGDRVHRIGQDKPITVHRLYVDDSVEQRVLQLQTVKRNLMERILGSGSQRMENRLTMRDFKMLLGLQKK